jgi:hypothetical protein
MISAKEIQPSQVRLNAPCWPSLVGAIVLASSNCLRRHFDLQEGETLLAPVPRIVTRKNPSLDNYFAELLLRSCYEAVDYLPPYEEHVLYGSPDELPSRLNAGLSGAILIGIGGRSRNPDFVKAYDEHAYHGTRNSASVSQIVFAEHLDRYGTRPGVNSTSLLLNEINRIDSGGGASYDHLYNILKSLNYAEFIQPGFVVEALDPQWKRAVIGACLSSICVAISLFKQYDLEEATRDLSREWDGYVARLERRVRCGFPGKINATSLAEVRRSILQPKEPQTDGLPDYLTLKRILFAFRHSWHPSVCEYLLEFLFEAMRQSQQSFQDIRDSFLPIRRIDGKHFFVYYRQRPEDRIPHRGLLARLNSERMKGILMVFNPAHKVTAVFCSRHLPKKIWRRFVDSLLKIEGDSVWYVPRTNDDDYASFALNGTESFRGTPRSSLQEEDFFNVFAEVVASCTSRAGTPHDSQSQSNKTP